MTKPGRIYISGPMTGHENHNFPAFHAAAEQFRKAGWEVANPAENFGGRTDLPREAYLRADMTMLARCDAIALLPGWERSAGATLETVLAKELGLQFFDAWSGTPMPHVPSTSYSAERGAASVLDTARKITEGARRDDYGHPADDFERAALMWTGILRSKLVPDQQVTATDIPLCMIAIKLARQSHRHKRDNLIDIAGYARTAAMVAGDE
ncbi:MAG TPA: DUF4406 domain-containing protein [Phycisphaerae bacterium]|nr:DUF4406 domain-containing protein [Phycisphaerae bacterium]HOM53601.1 DUF4406 domain-containing protein [Phycisphaerae bacterium]HON68294.1 DUF4406 domain-containing protein [Phycisphaerae bacterium]HPP28959.1 DUF4406 domain-containing protein [Phycisphaerae bacterium]HQA00400.1 DUF4406 domain-containing protein [Phycisphaerae bacterium]